MKFSIHEELKFSGVEGAALNRRVSGSSHLSAREQNEVL